MSKEPGPVHQYRIAAPLDDSNLGDAGAYAGSWAIKDDIDSYQGAYHALSPGASVTYTAPVTSASVGWVGDGAGAWVAHVDVVDGLGISRFSGDIDAADVTDGPRQLLFISGYQDFRPLTITISSVSGKVPIDAIGI